MSAIGSGAKALARVRGGEVPDTLVLEDRAALAVNALEGCVDQDHGSIPYMFVDLVSKPATMSHSCWDYGSSTGRLVDSLVLARAMVGNDEPSDVETALRRNLLGFLHEDGLSYRRRSAFSEPNANMHDQRATLLGLTSWYSAEGDETARAAADRLCGALKRISLKESDFWYFPCVEYTEHGWPSPDTLYMHTAVDPAHTNARIINPLVRFHRASGNSEALELAENYVRHTVHYSGAYNRDGSFNDGMEFRNGHFHSRMVSLAGIAKFAQLTGDAFYLNRVKRIYDWALSKSTAFGWTPGSLRKNKAYHHETCTLCDMIETGIILASGGYPEYWQCVERFVRNHLVEAQLVDTDWVAESDGKAADTPEQTVRRVASRSRGGFAGWAAPNDFVCETGHRFDIMTCCSAHGTRALYLAWTAAVSREGSRVRVNLLLNRSTPELDVYSLLPHEGVVVVRVKKRIGDLQVRLPRWAPPDAVAVERNARASADSGMPVLAGPFLKVGACAEGEDIVVRFPVVTARTTDRAWDQDFDTEWRGDNVVSIKPGGRHCPFYRRQSTGPECPYTRRSIREAESAAL